MNAPANCRLIGAGVEADLWDRAHLDSAARPG